jgi:NADH:ubiquinone oxidoreductase subunit C
MTTPTPVDTIDFSSIFPSFVVKDTRPGYSGVVVEKQHLVEFATNIHEEYGYDLLSSVTGVDYYPDDRMEVVYHALKTIGGPVLNFKVQVPRQDPIEVPSLISIFPGVELQEREIWDLFGIIFTGHPDVGRFCWTPS